jgi:catecholate siderophore receptor
VEAKGERLAYGIGAGTAPITPNKVPSYQRWDAMVSYEQRHYEIKLNVQNLFDKRYYDAIYENGAHVIPGTGRTVQLVTEIKY